jgi:hypothetical protein
LAPLSPDELRKLAAIMERCASPYDGQKLAAIHLAQQMLGRHGARWCDVLNTEPTPPIATPIRGWNTVARELMQHGVTDWEMGFLQSLILKARTLSPKQEAILTELCLKFGVPQWTAAP